MSAGTYDRSDFTSRRSIVLSADGGISVPGTAAANVELVRLPILDSITIDTARMVAMTGGTAAGPTVGIAKSLGGTGALVALATKSVGTSANNAGLTFTVTSTTLVAGDHLVLYNAAGTAASTPKVSVTIGYVETPGL